MSSDAWRGGGGGAELGHISVMLEALIGLVGDVGIGIVEREIDYVVVIRKDTAHRQCLFELLTSARFPTVVVQSRALLISIGSNGNLVFTIRNIDCTDTSIVTAKFKPYFRSNS